MLLGYILRRALRKAGLPELRFHDLRHIAASLMLEAGVSLKRVQQVIGHASETTTLKIYAHVMRRQRDDATDRIAVLARLAPSGNKRETIDDVEREESDVSDGSGSLALLLATFAPSLPAQNSPVLVGRVLAVTDGDTIKVLLQSGPIKVRLHGVDAPEKNQLDGQISKEALSNLVFDRKVELEVVEQRDAYDRLVAVVYLGDTNVNAELVKGGYAWAYREYLGQMEGDKQFCAYEETARSMKRGLWELPTDQWIAPWEWRHPERYPTFTDYSRETSKRCIAAIGTQNAGAANTQPLAAPAGAAGEREVTGKPFTCGTKMYCREMVSCEEARFYLAKCGLTRLDGDNDGVPCEELCR